MVPRRGRRRPAAGAARVPGAVRRGGRNPGRRNRADRRHVRHPLPPGRFAGHQLGLATAPAPWHTNRLAVTALGNALAAVLDAAGKIATDVLFLSRPEVAELAEPRAAGRGVSSAMPQKQNPVLSVLIRSAALQAPQLVAQLHLAAANFNDERPDAAWHTEWPALRQLLRLALGAAGHLRELAEGLQVFPVAMRRNLDLAGPLLLAEGVGAAVAPLWPRRMAARARSSCRTWWTGPSRRPPPSRGHLPAAAPRGRPGGRAHRSAARRTPGPGQLPGPGSRDLPAHPGRVPRLCPPACLPTRQSSVTPDRTEPTVAKPTLKAVLLSPERASGRTPLLVVGPSLGTSSLLWTEAAPARQ